MWRQRAWGLRFASPRLASHLDSSIGVKKKQTKKQRANSTPEPGDCPLSWDDDNVAVNFTQTCHFEVRRPALFMCCVWVCMCVCVCKRVSGNERACLCVRLRGDYECMCKCERAWVGCEWGRSPQWKHLQSIIDGQQWLSGHEDHVPNACPPIKKLTFTWWVWY